MDIPGIDIFTDNKVLLIGFSNKQGAFSREVYNSFEDAGITVYPYNPNKSDYDVKVYNSFQDIEDIPEVAVVLLNKESLNSEIENILSSGVKRVIINSKSHISLDVLDKFKRSSVELNILCPLLIVGNGFHKVHKFFAGLF